MRFLGLNRKADMVPYAVEESEFYNRQKQGGIMLSDLSPENRHLVEELIQRLHGNGKEPAIDYESHLDAWIANFLNRGNSGGVAKRYRKIVLDLLNAFPQPTKGLIDIYLTPKRIRFSASWLNYHICAIKSFFEYLSDQEIITKNPVARLSLVPLPIRERAIPSGEDIVKLLNSPVVKPKDRAMILLMLDCGLRLSEMRTLRLEDVNLGGLEVQVIGKGNKQRTVPMGQTTSNAITAYAMPRMPMGKYLFPKRDSDQPVGPQIVNERMVDLCRRAGVPNITPHQLRHYFATAMISDGANLPVVKELLGHSNIQTTMIYVHLSDTQRRKEHAKHSPLKGLGIDEGSGR